MALEKYALNNQELHFFSVNLRLAAVVEYLRSQQNDSLNLNRRWARYYKQLARIEVCPNRKRIGSLPTEKKRAIYLRAIEMAEQDARFSDSASPLGKARIGGPCPPTDVSRDRRSEGEVDRRSAKFNVNAVIEFIRVQAENAWSQVQSCARYYAHQALGALFPQAKTTHALTADQRHMLYEHAIAIATEDAETKTSRP